MSLKKIILMIFSSKIFSFALSEMWKEIFVDPRYLEGKSSFEYDKFYQAPSPPITNETYQVIDFACAMKCERRYWCNSWCLTPQSKICLLTNVHISPLHVTNVTGPYTCYTKQEEDFIVGATVTASDDPATVSPHMIVDNLVFGIYNYIAPMTCGNVYSTTITYNWILFKLNFPQIISEIRIDSQPYVAGTHSPNQAQVLISTSPPATPGSFGGFKNVGTFPGSVPSLTTYSFTFVATTVQYIAIYKSPIGGAMTLCHVMALLRD